MFIPKPLVGMPGLSGIGETEPIEDNPIRDKQAVKGARPGLVIGLQTFLWPYACWDV